MGDEALVEEMVARAWDETELPQTQFALHLRRLAAIYEEAPELARDPARSIDTSCVLCLSRRTAHNVWHSEKGLRLVCDDHGDLLADGAITVTEQKVTELRY